MGSVCCCLHVDDFEDYMNPENSEYRNCLCLSCFVQNFLHVYTSIFRRGQVHSVPSSIQGAASLTSSSLDNSLAEMYRSPPRPLPYDADPRCSRLQRDGLVSRREKGSSHSHEESEPLRSDNDADSESFSTGDKWNASACEGGKEQRSRSSLKLLSAKATVGIGYVYSSSEEEDVCPTCLDEYTSENPKIMTKCSHHFHLGCIYEWMERSDSCPVCGKVTIVALFSSNLLIQFSIFILEIYQSVHFLILEIFQYCLTSPPGYWNHFYEAETCEVYRKPNFFVPFGSLSFEKNFRLFFFFYPQIHVCLHTFCCEASQNR
ncbi:hypothetical protein H0E87_028053 [Populus deltoides]|uniref:RING-type E3 ubiquitin transferase n=1 Tax=Populus deltoides TaxID=3696 RepID=A0A8T2WRG4_POPDE|nr:hypothetical protein H0E87_028053 [Populus deltoides]